MAGGMTRGGRGERLPLAERVRGSAPPSSGTGEGGAAPRRELARHCWVVEAPDQPGRWAGLVVEWRQEPAGWIGRVVFAVPEASGAGLRVIERWLPGHCLEPLLLGQR